MGLRARIRGLGTRLRTPAPASEERTDADADTHHPDCLAWEHGACTCIALATRHISDPEERHRAGIAMAMAGAAGTPAARAHLRAIRERITWPPGRDLELLDAALEAAGVGDEPAARSPLSRSDTDSSAAWQAAYHLSNTLVYTLSATARDELRTAVDRQMGMAPEAAPPATPGPTTTPHPEPPAASADIYEVLTAPRHRRR